MKRFFIFFVLIGIVVAQADPVPERDASSTSTGPAGAKAAAGKLLKVVFSGATVFNNATLRKGIVRQIATIEKYGLDEPSAYDAAFFLESFYREHGYAHAEARFSIVGPRELHLAISEGPLATVGSVEIRGNEAFDAATLNKYLLGPLRERFPRIQEITHLPFVRDDIFDGVGLVRRLYASGGYLDAVIDPPEVAFNSGNTVATVELTIDEGIAYRFGDIRLTGNLIYPREDLLAIIQKQTQDIYTEGRMAAAARALQDYYVKRGYFTAEVEPSSDLAAAAAHDGQVAATFHIASGALYHFDGVTVSGAEGVKPSFIEARLCSLSGKTYSPETLNKSFRTLIKTGLFRNVRLTPEAIAGDQVRINVSVEETNPKEFGFGLGYASFYGGIASVSYRDLNFLRSGRSLGANVEVNQRGFSGEIVYENPWLFDTDYQLTLRLYAVNAVLKGYSKNEISFRPTLTRNLAEHWSVSAFLTAKAVGVYDLDIEPASLAGTTDYTVFALGFSQTIDYRNDPALPTQGYIFTTSLDVAPSGLGEVAYVRGLGRFSWYLPVTAKSTLAFGVRGGIISALSDKGLPIDERFFNGGATTVRSFSELTLGPRDHAGYPLGGQGFTVFNIEYDFPIIGDLYGAVFTDAGNVISEAADFGLENMRYAVGVGLRYNLPIGAIRFDYGYNPCPGDGDPQGAFHFAIGTAF